MNSGEKLSCTIGTKNAAIDIRGCLESVKWADEIIVVDDFSTDGTVEIARQYTDKVFQKRLTGYTEQKNYALEKTSYRWVLSLDADERVTEELRDEISGKLSAEKDCSGYLFRRLNIFLGKEVRHCGWYEADNLRLFNKEKVGYDLGVKYLESMKVSGKLGVMKNDLVHYTCRRLDDYINRVNLWTTLNAKDLTAKGVRIRPVTAPYYFVFKPVVVFCYKYFIKAGFLDGFRGFLICGFSAFTYFISYAKLWEQENKETARHEKTT
ncbi:MAG: glycosyltransferase family 2 protein [Candidatus Omnitrophica bacterium]|nr:glycosyltransferase family 2 protein [Candidatus Omnitrophota bacterium]